MEIMDEREKNYMFSRYEEFQTDLEIVRVRYETLRDTPRLSECKRFPVKDAASMLCVLNRELKDQLITKMAWNLDRVDLYEAAMKELDKTYIAWDALRDSQNEFYYITTRRQALKKLKYAIGDKFDNGDMPDAIPKWIR